MDLKNKKVLLMGLGVLGGGVATARFLVEQGADLTVTDLKDKEYLKPSLEKLEDLKEKINFILGEHREKDFLESEIIVINPDVSVNNKFVELAKKNGKQIENELTLFYKLCPSKKIIAITGTRGKTTTTNWTYHILKSHYENTILLGNSPDKPFLQEIKKINKDSSVVVEVPSYHLEIVNEHNFKPHIAVITNLYRDHINRHKSMEEYAEVKANIFKGQTIEDFLILNYENEWTDIFRKQNPKSKVLFFSKKEAETTNLEFINKWGSHNLENWLASSLVASVLGVPEQVIQNSILTLPQIKFREEKVYKDNHLEIYNDTAATSPEATMVAIARFSKGENLILIAGGTDRELDFKLWAEVVNKNLKPENLILLSGSATEKMKKELDWDNFNEFDTLEECLNKALEMSNNIKGKVKILFSPGAKSFEKFKNEFDRGEQFNKLVENIKL